MLPNSMTEASALFILAGTMYVSVWWWRQWWLRVNDCGDDIVCVFKGRMRRYKWDNDDDKVDDVDDEDDDDADGDDDDDDDFNGDDDDWAQMRVGMAQGRPWHGELQQFNLL